MDQIGTQKVIKYPASHLHIIKHYFSYQCWEWGNISVQDIKQYSCSSLCNVFEMLTNLALFVSTLNCSHNLVECAEKLICLIWKEFCK
jgi:hypothetical protein